MFVEAGKKPEASKLDEPCWENLASYHCPFCEGTIELKENIAMYFCSDCDFKISEERYEQILSNLEERF